ncbi:hypothetical protein Glove_551g7 [Diversispora epigaea]|uniref:Uncharacterized protein n=1 Tax=Diversispora epigaea TaxID=1348612 RepID=A0A397GGB2_9GLOM|nr:hypothetical protein Glove_551g7 [Diversispora epigaea]
MTLDRPFHALTSDSWITIVLKDIINCFLIGLRNQLRNYETKIRFIIFNFQSSQPDESPNENNTEWSVYNEKSATGVRACKESLLDIDVCKHEEVLVKETEI